MNSDFLKSIVIIFTLIYACKCFSAEETKGLYAPIFSINEAITALSTQDDFTPQEIEKALKKLHVNFATLNSAEKYLYLILKAKSSYGDNKHNKIITYLTQAKSLESGINSDQLHYLPFLTLYKNLSHSYSALGNFKQAYDARHVFIKKYDIYSYKEREKHIFELEKKYETQRKKDFTTLLNNETQLGAFQINESLDEETIQRRNIYIISFLVVVFLFLLIRLWFTNKGIYTLSQKDSLTGLINRKVLFSNGELTVKRCQEQQSSLCVLAINIDDFKLLNTLNGDYIGDEILKQFALLGTEVVRTRDVFSRIEGATFIAILPEASIDEAKAIAQHFKHKVAEFNFDYVGLNQRLDISVGITKLSESLNNFELLLNTAMNVLYEIRDAGGNHIKTYKEYV